MAITDRTMSTTILKWCRFLVLLPLGLGLAQPAAAGRRNPVLTLVAMQEMHLARPAEISSLDMLTYDDQANEDMLELELGTEDRAVYRMIYTLDDDERKKLPVPHIARCYFWERGKMQNPHAATVFPLDNYEEERFWSLVLETDRPVVAAVIPLGVVDPSAEWGHFAVVYQLKHAGDEPLYGVAERVDEQGMPVLTALLLVRAAASPAAAWPLLGGNTLFESSPMTVEFRDQAVAAAGKLAMATAPAYPAMDAWLTGQIQERYDQPLTPEQQQERLDDAHQTALADLAQQAETDYKAGLVISAYFKVAALRERRGEAIPERTMAEALAAPIHAAEAATLMLLRKQLVFVDAAEGTDPYWVKGSEWTRLLALLRERFAITASRNDFQRIALLSVGEPERDIQVANDQVQITEERTERTQSPNPDYGAWLDRLEAAANRVEQLGGDVDRAVARSRRQEYDKLYVYREGSGVKEVRVSRRNEYAAGMADGISTLMAQQELRQAKTAYNEILREEPAAMYIEGTTSREVDYTVERQIWSGIARRSATIQGAGIDRAMAGVFDAGKEWGIRKRDSIRGVDKFLDPYGARGDASIAANERLQVAIRTEIEMIVAQNQATVDDLAQALTGRNLDAKTVADEVKLLRLLFGADIHLPKWARKNQP